MVSIVEVTTKAQLRRFVDYPNQLYKDVPQFVPATYGDDLADWDRSKNPAFSYCDARCWLAERDGEIVGRIGAIRSRKANEKWGVNRMRFTQTDFIEIRRCPPPCSPWWRIGPESWAARRFMGRWALPTWIGRVCWWRASTAGAAFLPIIIIPTISTT